MNAATIIWIVFLYITPAGEPVIARQPVMTFDYHRCHKIGSAWIVNNYPPFPMEGMAYRCEAEVNE